MTDSPRKVLYKNAAKDFDSLRKQRQDHSIELRKQKKIETLQKRRNIQLDDDDSSPIKQNDVPKTEVEALVMQLISCNSPTDKLQLLVECRKLLSQRNNPPIDEFCKSGAVPILMKIITDNSSSDELLFETAWALTNIASGESEHTAQIVNHDGIQLFIKFLGHHKEMIVEQCIWALSNIVGDCAEYRDSTLKYDIISEIESVVNRYFNSNSDILRNLAWLISNLCRYKSANGDGLKYLVSSIKRLMPIIQRIMVDQKNDATIIADLTWGLSYAAECSEELINYIVQSKSELKMVAEHIMEGNMELAAPSLRLLGNIIAGNNEQTDAALNAGAIDGLKAFLQTCDQPRLIKEALWVLSNISAGTDEQLMQLVDSGVLLNVLHVMKNGGDYKSQKEAAWVISNTCSNKKTEPKMYLLNHGVFESLVGMLNCDDAAIVEMLLDCVRDLFMVADEFGQLEECARVFEEIGGIDTVEKLQNHQCEDIYFKSYRLVTDYLGGVEDDNDDDQTDLVEALREKFDF